MNNNNKVEVKQKISLWKKIKSKYILKRICQVLNKEIILKIINYNKSFQKILNIDLSDYMKFSETEIEITLSDNKYIKYCRNIPFINFNNEEDESFYHIYYNNSNEEIKSKNKNYISSNLKKIKVIIEFKVKSLFKLFNSCNYVEKINFIRYRKNNKTLTDMSYMFSGCTSLKEINLSNLNTNNTKNMSYMFSGCASLKELNISNFNTNNVSDMSHMFSRCTSLKKLKLSKFNTNNVTNMSYMFNECSSLKELNISKFNTNNVTNMSYMFYNCASLNKINFSHFKTNNVIKMNFMFSGCKAFEDFNNKVSN